MVGVVYIKVIMNLAASGKPMIAKDMFVLMAHGIIWFLLYLSISKWRKWTD